MFREPTAKSRLRGTGAITFASTAELPSQPLTRTVRSRLKPLWGSANLARFEDHHWQHTSTASGRYAVERYGIVTPLGPAHLSIMTRYHRIMFGACAAS